jgi:hypothetical protein
MSRLYVNFEDLSSYVGEEAALRLCDHLGGSRIWVPVATKVHDGLQLVQAIGVDAASLHSRCKLAIAVFQLIFQLRMPHRAARSARRAAARLFSFSRRKIHCQRPQSHGNSESQNVMCGMLKCYGSKVPSAAHILRRARQDS